MAEIKDFTDLIAWQHAHKLAVGIYKVSRDFPKDEIYALTSQIRRAASSISFNIAEGFGRRTIADKISFYNMAQTSLDEVRSQLFLVIELKYAKVETVKELQASAIETRRIISGLIKSLEGTKNDK